MLRNEREEKMTAHDISNPSVPPSGAAYSQSL